MSEPFVAEIRIWALNFAPRGWAFCNGQLLPIAQNTALFSLIGTTYGGDGRTTTALPDLQGRSPMHPGRGPGLTDRQLGQSEGQSTHALTLQETPSHTHSLQAFGAPGASNTPGGNTLARSQVPTAPFYNASTANQVNLAPEALPPAGDGQDHENKQPYLALTFCIALVGIYPSRG
jgi:microcystin-dependent protein